MKKTIHRLTSGLIFLWKNPRYTTDISVSTGLASQWPHNGFLTVPGEEVLNFTVQAKTYDAALQRGIALSLQEVGCTTSPAVPYNTCSQARSYVSPEEAAFNAALAESLKDSLEKSKVGQRFACWTAMQVWLL